jgi:hypothetical protein
MLFCLFHSFSDDIRAQEETKEWAKWHAEFLPDFEEPLEPVSDYFYPIVDDLRRVKVAGAEDYNPAEHRLVGVVAASIYWRAMIRYDVSSVASSLVISTVVIALSLSNNSLLQGIFCRLVPTAQFWWSKIRAQRSFRTKLMDPASSTWALATIMIISTIICLCPAN